MFEDRVLLHNCSHDYLTFLEDCWFEIFTQQYLPLYARQATGPAHARLVTRGKKNCLVHGTDVKITFEMSGRNKVDRDSKRPKTEINAGFHARRQLAPRNWRSFLLKHVARVGSIPCTIENKKIHDQYSCSSQLPKEERFINKRGLFQRRHLSHRKCIRGCCMHILQSQPSIALFVLEDHTTDSWKPSILHKSGNKRQNGRMALLGDLPDRIFVFGNSEARISAAARQIRPFTATSRCNAIWQLQIQITFPRPASLNCRALIHLFLHSTLVILHSTQHILGPLIFPYHKGHTILHVFLDILPA